VFPDPHVFSHRAITTARNITQDPVEPQLLQSFDPILLGGRRDLDYRVYRRVEIRNHERRTGESGRLMNEEVRPFVIAVVGQKKP
jgi:hypothetical protein